MPPSRPRTSSPSAKASRSNSGKPLTEKAGHAAEACPAFSSDSPEFRHQCRLESGCRGVGGGCQVCPCATCPCIHSSCAHISRVHATVRPVLPSIRTACPSIPRLHIERTSPLHRPHTKRIREASTDRRTSDARYAWPAIRTTAERTRIADRVQSRPQQQPKNPPAYAPNTRLSTYTRHPTRRCSKLPAMSPPVRNSYPSHRRTSRHIAHSTAQPKQQPTHRQTQQGMLDALPSKKTAGQLQHSSTQQEIPAAPPLQKRPVPAPMNAASYPPLQRTTQRKAATAPSPGPGKPQAAPCRRTTRPARPQTIRPSSKPAGPNRTTSRYKRKSARTERSVCADLHRVQGNPCGDITSSCRRWSSWRPSEPKPSLRQPSGPSERQPSWVRPF